MTEKKGQPGEALQTRHKYRPTPIHTGKKDWATAWTIDIIIIIRRNIQTYFYWARYFKTSMMEFNGWVYCEIRCDAALFIYNDKWRRVHPEFEYKK